MKKMTLYSILVLMCIGCQQQNSDDTIMTVTGPMSVREMGVTLPHEHLLVDFIGADSTGYERWDRTAVVNKVLPYLLELKEYGVRTFIDCTPAYLGRDPWLLQELSEKSGIYILTTTGFYGAYGNKFVPRFAVEMTAEQLAEMWTNEYENGIEGSGVRPGIIKIAVERNQPLSDIHKKLVMAAALTHLKTGLTIVSHTGPEAPAFEQIELLESIGVSPSAFVWTHANEGSPEAHVELANRGAWISLDKTNTRPEMIQHLVNQIKNLNDHGLLNKVLISHDAGWFKPEQENGGEFRPFTSIFTHLLPALKESGLTDADIELLMIKNPQQAFAVRVEHVAASQ